MSDTDQQELRVPTLGEYRVGINFNPGGHVAVNEIKRRAADLIDYIHNLPPHMAHPDSAEEANTLVEVHRLKEEAMMNIETAAMHAVKAATKPVAPETFETPNLNR